MSSFNKSTSLKLTGLLVATLIFACASLGWISTDAAEVAYETPEATPKPKPTPKPRVNYGEFPHSVQAHKLECSKCHKYPTSNWKSVRPEKDAFPDIADYPRHESCLECHKQQFFKGTPPKICSICHTTPGPRISNRWPFPNPRETFDRSAKGKTHESDFLVGFPHDKHIEIVSGHGSSAARSVNASYSGRAIRAAEESCKVCHQTMMPQGKSPDEFVTKPPANIGEDFWLKKGTFKTAPIGHSLCFTCHSTDTGVMPTPDTCSGCHKLRPSFPKTDFDPMMAKKMGITDKVMLDNWSHRTSSGKFGHEFVAHTDMECATCHTVTKLDTANPLTKKVPMSGCATCHATPKAEDGGALNYEVDQRKKDPKFDCVKCHVTFGKLPIPETHLQALAAAK